MVLGKLPPCCEGKCFENYAHDSYEECDNLEHYRTALLEAAEELEKFNHSDVFGVDGRYVELINLAKKLRISAGEKL